MSTVDDADKNLRWYQGIPRYAWLVFAVATLGWLLDCMDQNLFNLIRIPSVTELLKLNGVTEGVDKLAKEVGGQITAVFLIGWAVGGFTFGVLGDRLGRTKTMVITIFIYALFTGLSGLAQNPMQYAICRFLTALGVGGEFAAGAALVAEVWPNRSRPMALGMLQALSAVGNMSAAVVVGLLANQSWRVVYIVGALPAILIIWIRSSVKEPERWQQAKDAAAAEGTSKELGKMSQMFTDPVLRRNTIAGVLLATAGVGGMWGVGFFKTDLDRAVLAPLVAGMAPAAAKAQINVWISQAFFIQNIGAFFGMFSYAALSQYTGRRAALLLFLILAFLSVEGTFWGVHDLNSSRAWSLVLGFCALAPFSAFAVYFPELYPTRLRSTGVGFCYNCARILAAGAPFALGALASKYAVEGDPSAGFRKAASIVACIYLVGLVGLIFAPETKGKPLPE
jgi:MFS family permease